MSISAVLIGHDTLTLHCGRTLLEGGHRLAAVVTRHPGVRSWAEDARVPVHAPGDDLASDLRDLNFDWLLSVANLDIIPSTVLALARRGAVNFHDGPLPERAGLNAPVWALLDGAAEHGVTWHLIDGGVDEGPVLASRRFPIAEGETALSLNTRCFAAGLESFPEVLAQLDGALHPAAQDLGQRRHLHKGKDRPRAGGVLDLARPAAELAALVRALDHGDYPNPIACPKLDLGGSVLLVGGAEVVGGSGEAGQVLESRSDEVTVATGQGALRLSGLRPLSSVMPKIQAGQPLPLLTAERISQIDAAVALAARHERHWRSRLLDLHPAALPMLGGTRHQAPLRRAIHGSHADVALTLLACPSDTSELDFALGQPNALVGFVAPWVPFRVSGSTLGAIRTALSAKDRVPGPMAADLIVRLGGHPPEPPQIGISEEDHVPGTVLTLVANSSGTILTGDPARLSPEGFDLLADRLEHLMANLAGRDDASSIANLLMIPASEWSRIDNWNGTDAPFDDRPINVLISEQASLTPDAPALAYRASTITFAEMETRAERLAGSLRALGVRPGIRVGLHLGRSMELVIGALAILKAGGAYVPLDPAYPADRIALYLEDSEAAVVLTDSTLAGSLPAHMARTLRIDGPMPEGVAGEGPSSEDLAYLIYTSGSTGRPKGVMVSHRNVANFFAGMDARIGVKNPGTWLAVTSLSFDISVLELFWTLARGFKVVVMGDEERALAAGDAPSHGSGMDFSLFYWGNDDGVGRDKYRLLLDGAKIADENGFCAVWTPERHFHAFGGPYPNPSVTGAAVAAITRNIAVRAGSVVTPLHHPARIAEEWAVIDNLTNGRTGLAVASGWMPEDFVLRPENAVPRNKAAMIESIHQLRKLWTGEAVEFQGPNGPQAVRTQPRPVSKSLPLWVTTAGNPETWREAGALGANVLTHLLGQSIAEVEQKIAIYHAALRDAGHDPRHFTVTLMLHTYLADTREAAEETARGPMKAYLRSAAALIKQYAWAFPAFKKPQGAAQPLDIDLRSLSEEELDAILEFAFLRYFEDSGLFGTVDDALARIEQVKAIGVGEVACLIDYGIPVQKVLDGLVPLSRVVAQHRGHGPASDDFSISAQVVRHGVTHLQCTPSMARMLVTNPDSSKALGQLSHVLVGGEALPGSLASELRATGARVTNMYGPTETTIWSSTAEAMGGLGTVGLGPPIANTQFHVLDEAMKPLPVGAEGELWIGGSGVAKGYWKRPDLTSDRFVADPFRNGGRLYRTGDLVRRTADGGLDFLGRADHQVKLRGFRIELGEIEAVLDAEAGIIQSVVVAREDVPGNVQLVAYVTSAEPVDERALRDRLARMLPVHMVPARIVRLDAFPLTPNRKVDRKALPIPGARETPRTTPTAHVRVPSAGAPIVVPTPVTSQGSSLPQISAIWSSILGVDGLGPKDNFFDLGGHSLLAVQAHRDIRTALGVETLSITDIFRFPTLGALVQRVDSLSGADVVVADAPPVLAEDQRMDAMARRRELRARRLTPT
ncbi:LLM class flavin-dependent oxidoreductase [Rubellimicrobium rubrum]|uniref:LLM class flavin-dependent oxidoreductase n=1 Tax=Rubellimicrobium rubrum TaxID=2585369 RepID=A0A5C4N0R6_9RHOB|nr:MupA/Atu3671 family FMN-dependent luciferase-like monooxygenase [Rubellimicrobium rubrum]TNC50403.1 LLM class flavin-dependent oxidoreductase [Rubellimicrobium rubrum]